MTNLSIVEDAQAHQVDKLIIPTYPSASFVSVKSDTIPMTKSYVVNDGRLEKTSAGSPVDGIFTRIDEHPLDKLLDGMKSCGSYDAIIHGVIKDHQEIGICTKRNLKSECLARTKENFSYPKNSLLLFDYDPDDREPEALNVAKFMTILQSIDPQLLECAYISKSSASSGIRLDGKLLTCSKGFHLYMAIPGEHLKLYAKKLFKLLILNNHGYVSISANGRKSIRTVFDATVHSPERLDYIAPAIVQQPLTMDELEYFSRQGVSINATLLPELTVEQNQEFQKIRQKLLDDAADEAFEVRKKNVKIQSNNTGISQEKLLKCYMMGDQSKIDFEHPLTKNDNTQFSFADVVASPDEYINLSMPDPFDPNDGPNKAQLYINDNRTIVINSFAHGGTVYKLHRDGKLYNGELSKFKREFKMIGPSEILSKPSVPNWIIKGYIAQKSTVQLIGESGLGKTFATIDIGLSVATGRDWNNCKVAQGPVAYLNAEGHEGVHARIKGWQQECQSIIGAPFLLSTEALDLTDDSAVASAQVALDKFAQEHNNRISLIIVDTMRRSMSGDENSSQVIEKFLNNLEYLCKLYGATALINHHPGHSIKNKGQARGSSAQFAAMDVQLLLCKKTGGLQLECKKLKDGGALPSPVGFKLKVVQLSDLDDDGEHVTTCIPEYIPLSGHQSTRAVKLKHMSEGLIDTLKSFGNILKSNGTTEAPKKDWRDELVTLRTLQDSCNSTDITTAKKMFSRSFKELTEAGVVVINSAGNYQYGNDIEPQWSNVKSYVPGEYFK